MGNLSDIVISTDSLKKVDHYEYSPFGEFLKGHCAVDIGFEGKLFFPEFSFLYYGHRIYFPNIGRWISRDHVQEFGGNNLFLFVKNSPNNLLDFLGDAPQWIWASSCCSLDAKGNDHIRLSPDWDYREFDIFLGVPHIPAACTYELNAPGPWDQFNPFGIRGESGVENYTNWFENRFPKTITGARSIFDERIKTAICNQMANMPSSLPNMDGTVEDNDVDINSNMKRFGDMSENFWERNVMIGSFEIKCREIKISWSSNCCFTYTATMYVLEQTGADRPWEKGGEICMIDPLWFTGMFVKRNVEMAKWTISGLHCCEN